MDYRPFAVFAHPNADRLHNAAAAGSAVSRLLVDVQARKAVWAVITVAAARAMRKNRAVEHLSGKGVAACMRLIISFFVLLSFVLPIHGIMSS